MGMFRLAVAVGMMGLGAIAVFMGAVVLISSLSSGKVSYSVGRDGATIATSHERSGDPSGYWRALGLTGGLPAVLGLFAVWYGRRVLKS
jgi:hypothetical protein